MRQPQRVKSRHAADGPNGNARTLRRRLDATEQNPRSRERILVVDDDVARCRTILSMLGNEGFDAVSDVNCRSALSSMHRHGVDLVIAEIATACGADLLRQLRDHYPDVPVIIKTTAGTASEVALMTRADAADYLVEPVQADLLLATVRRVLDESTVQRDRRRRLGAGGAHLKGIVGRSAPMRSLYHQISRVAASHAPVLITGETGTGKELIARAVHAASGREPFVPVNCGAIPPNLLESELFGHVRGAFTGADRDRVGLFQAADGGTMFLDEVAELPVAVQSKLLRVLQSGELRRVGDVATRYVYVRLIAATHRSLDMAVAEGQFREDLYYRINVLELSVPPLRQRTSDIPLLAERFLASTAARDRRPEKRFTPAALAHLLTHAWPGNVRQLENTVERLAVLCESPTISVDDLPDEFRGVPASTPVLECLGQELPLADIEREHILGVLARANGNRSRAAEILGIPRRTLYRRLREYGVIARKPRLSVR